MVKSKIDRTGEVRHNTFGSKMVIVGYRMNRDMDVYFPEYDWTFKNAHYSSFKNGNIKCPYDRSVYGIGYIGEGRYKVYDKNGKITKCYATWNHMLQRCYSEKYHEKQPTYTDCEASEDFHNFQNYGKWFDNNYYKIEGEKMCLDKDILYKGNKIYSPENCIFVPQTINNLFTKSDKSRGESCIGTCFLKNGKYVVHCSLINPETGKSKNKHLGYYDTQEKGFEVYKYYKEKNIKEVADYFKGQIPQILYNALYEYEVEITD